MQKFFLLILSGFSLLLSNCAVYKIDVQQGNVVTQEMLDQLEVGMPTQKVRFIMGTPLIIDVFHQQRWDYFYSFQAGGDERQQRHISLFFDKDHLQRIEGDVTISTGDKQKTKPTPDKSEQPPIL